MRFDWLGDFLPLKIKLYLLWFLGNVSEDTRKENRNKKEGKIRNKFKFNNLFLYILNLFYLFKFHLCED